MNITKEKRLEEVDPVLLSKGKGGKGVTHKQAGQEAQTFPWSFSYSFLLLARLSDFQLRAPVFSHSVSDRWSTPVIHQVQGHGVIPIRNPLPPLASLLAPENCRYHAASKVMRFTNPWRSRFGGQPLSGSRRGRSI